MRVADPLVPSMLVPMPADPVAPSRIPSGVPGIGTIEGASASNEQLTVVPPLNFSCSPRLPFTEKSKVRSLSETSRFVLSSSCGTTSSGRVVGTLELHDQLSPDRNETLNGSPRLAAPPARRALRAAWPIAASVGTAPS